jgi:V/A-type H+/Na+-transporting ATPase subunit D
MAIRFQYNKTSLQDMNKQLNIRVRALPTIKNKESALRIEVKKAKDNTELIDSQLKQKQTELNRIAKLWTEFHPDIVKVDTVIQSIKKIAGVKTPTLEDVEFTIETFSFFNNPAWFYDGVLILKDFSKLSIERSFSLKKTQILEHARKKTTQKVNLYEKVQIPEYKEAIRKIKRFLEDEENLSKSSQKIVKKRQQEAEEVEV